MFLIKWKGSDEADLVPARQANVKCSQVPLLVFSWLEISSWHRRWWYSSMRSDCPGTLQARMRTSNHSRLKDIALTGILKSDWDEDFSDPPGSCPCSAVRSLWPVQCDAENTFPVERSQPNIVLLACEEQFFDTRSLFRWFWLTTCPTVYLIVLLWWCKTESYLVIIMHLWHTTVF